MKAITIVATATKTAAYKTAKGLLSATHFVGYITCQGSLQLEMKLDKDVDPQQIATERTDKSHDRMQSIIRTATNIVNRQKDIASQVHAETSVEIAMIESSISNPPVYKPFSIVNATL